MRVIAGTLRGRRLRGPRGRDTRPTSDRVKEALFSVLGAIDGWQVLDLYAGSGALAIEALSRGARRAVLVERAKPALRVIYDNLRDLDVADRATVLAGLVDRLPAVAISHGPFDLLLVDPPYSDVATGRTAAVLERYLAEHRRQWPTSLGDSPGPPLQLVLEHATRDAPPQLESAHLVATRLYGDTAISLYTEVTATNNVQR